MKIIEAEGYEIGIQRERGEVMVRLTDNDDCGAQLVLFSEDAYKLAQRIMKAYDELEGI